MTSAPSAVQDASADSIPAGRIADLLALWAGEGATIIRSPTGGLRIDLRRPRPLVLQKCNRAYQASPIRVNDRVRGATDSYKSAFSPISRANGLGATAEGSRCPRPECRGTIVEMGDGPRCLLCGRRPPGAVESDDAERHLAGGAALMAAPPGAVASFRARPEHWRVELFFRGRGRHAR